MKKRLPRHPRKMRPRRQGPLMKRYTVECPDCKRHYDLDFTGPVKFCTFCRSDNIKVKHRPAPSPFVDSWIRALALGAGFAVMSKYLDQTLGKSKPARTSKTQIARRKQDAKP